MQRLVTAHPNDAGTGPGIRPARRPLASVQAPSIVLMIRPHRFRSNVETAGDNAFQRLGGDPAEEAAGALAEFDRVAAALTEAGVRVVSFDDAGANDTPDSVYPNNWISTHAGGRVAVFPMYSHSRRRERRADVIEVLKRDFRVQEVVDYSGLEHDSLFLEGTGAMVLDHMERVAYVARSYRADQVVLERFCTVFGYEPMAFDSADADGRPIYHTNVMMSVATEFALVGLSSIVDPQRRAEIAERLEASGRQVIDLDHSQIARFAGNALELTGHHGRLLALSTTAQAALRPEQVRAIEACVPLLPLDVPTIERGGGSVRCMLAGIHLTPRAT